MDSAPSLIRGPAAGADRGTRWSRGGGVRVPGSMPLGPAWWGTVNIVDPLPLLGGFGAGEGSHAAPAPRLLPGARQAGVDQESARNRAGAGLYLPAFPGYS